MGTFKTEASKNAKIMRKAQAMAESFAKNKTPEFLKRFLESSGIAAWISASDNMEESEVLTELVKDPQVDLHFGMALAIAYSMGYSDHARGATLRQLYVSSDLADKKEEVADKPGTQLILPFDKDGA